MWLEEGGGTSLLKDFSGGHQPDQAGWVGGQAWHRRKISRGWQPCSWCFMHNLQSAKLCYSYEVCVWNKSYTFIWRIKGRVGKYSFFCFEVGVILPPLSLSSPVNNKYSLNTSFYHSPSNCAVPENIHISPMEGQWKFQGGGGWQKQHFERKVWS